MADIKARPNSSVTSLSVKREKNGSHTLTASWKVPSWLKSSSNEKRATELVVSWWLGISGTDPKRSDTVWDESTTSRGVNLNNSKFGSKTYTRDSFYPLSSRKLAYVSCRVQPRNGKGLGTKHSDATIQFKRPRKPSIDAFDFDVETGKVSTTIKTNAGEDAQERYDTEYYFRVYHSPTKTYSRDVHATSTSTSIALSHDAAGYQQLPYDGYYRITVKARARGYAGDSDWTERTYYLSYPGQATITGMDVTSRDSSGKATVHIKANGTTEHPVDRVQLQILADCDYADASSIPASASWDETESIDNGTCNALAVSVGDVMPSAGRYSWVRIKSWHANENVLYRYSVPYRVEALEVPSPTAGDDQIVIISAMSGDDGASAVLVLGWNADGTDDATGTEVTHATDVKAWRSNEPPEASTFTWSDGPLTHAGVTYHDSATYYLFDLPEGVTSHIRARRYMEGETGTTYGEYSDVASVMPSVAPSNVVLTAPGYVAEGEGVPLTWSYDGGGVQRSWRLEAAGGEIDAGSDALGSYELPASRAEELAEDGVLTLSVSVSTGGGWAASEPVTVSIERAPEVVMAAPGTMTAQPLSIGFTSETAPDLLLTVTSMGTSGEWPDGMRTQPEGDVVWSDLVHPEWDDGETTVTLPGGLDFLGGEYEVRATPVDPLTSLVGEEQAATVAVEWVRRAPYPEGFVTVTAAETVDADGVTHRAATIELSADPQEEVETDVYDIYRLTADGAQLIGQSWPLQATAVDEYAPYGTGVELAYRVACRTVDGDVDWCDVGYTLDCRDIRIDWLGGSVQLPYNVAIDDGWEKPVDVHRYLDGSVDAFYGAGVTRSVKLSTDVMRVGDAATVASLRALARHTGTVFVRTPDGSAYEADVQLSSMGGTGGVLAVQLDATEVRATDAFALPPLVEEVEP